MNLGRETAVIIEEPAAEILASLAYIIRGKNYKVGIQWSGGQCRQSSCLGRLLQVGLQR